MYASVTRLQSFNLLRTTEWMTVERYTEQIEEEYVPQEPALIGRDLHRFMDMRPVAPGQIESEYGFEYDREQVAEMVNGLPPDTLRESQGSITIPTSMGDLFVPCRADSLHGLVCRDYKTSAKSADPEFHADSVQWRLYLWIFACRIFEYEFLKVDRDRRGSGRISITRETPLRLYWYDGIPAECQALAEDFVCSMKRMGLLHTMLTRPEKERLKNG